MEEVYVETWDDLEQRVAAIADRHSGASLPLLFRGQRESRWAPETTLEREAGNWTLRRYYEAVHRVRPQLEAFTGRRWDVPVPPFVNMGLDDYDRLSVEFSFGRLPGYEYLVYLRHMGFPSPLLDWSRSLYVAAFFAFRHQSQSGPTIYMFLEAPKNFKLHGSDHPNINRFGANAPTHPRHFLQQAVYTLCTQFEGEWRFAPHVSVISSGEAVTQDMVWKFVLPADVRRTVLRRLETFNLNAYSLFNSDETLVESLALREVFLPSD